MPDGQTFLTVATALAVEASASLMETFGGRWEVSYKREHSSVVTAADLRSERLIVDGLRRHFPSHSVITEETGCDLHDSNVVWVIDPLDGTSNYASGIPWFGVLIAVMKDSVPVAAVMHLPVTGDLYTAEAGAGAFLNGRRIAVTTETWLRDVLWGFAMDAGGSEAELTRHARILAQLVHRARNVRGTNSLVDAAFTADGRFGGFYNQNMHLWDIVAPMLVVQEAGGLYTDPLGQPLQLDLSATAAEREYAGLAGAPALHRQVAEIVAQCGAAPGRGARWQA
jgi:myo-inositol-1(or 4)-monophosphatase